MWFGRIDASAPVEPVAAAKISAIVTELKSPNLATTGRMAGFKKKDRKIRRNYFNVKL
jgi:hypothetical protein